MTALIAGGRAAALVVAGHARDAAELARLLDMLGLLAQPARPPQVRPRIRPHDVHSRGRYVPGCPACRAVNAAYARRYRHRPVAAAAPVTPMRTVHLVLVPTPPRSRRRACEGQLLLEVS